MISFFRRKYSFFLIILTSHLIIGCQSNIISSSTSIAPKKTQTIQSTVLIQTSTPSPEDTYSLPSITPSSPTIQVLPTSPSSTIEKHVPTMSPDDALERVLGLLSDNSGCKLPCWWGIVPGETTLTETLQFLNEIGESAAPIPQSDGTVVYDAGGFDLEKMKIYNSVSFYEKSGLIDAISIRSEGHNLEGFLQVWDPYKPQQIIQKYGKPSRIWINSSYSYGNSKRRGYDLLIFYDNLGILIAYSGIVKFDSIYHICPWFDQAEDIQTIKMYLQSPENPLPLERLTNYLIYPEYTVPIENGGLTLDDLYSIFIEEEQPCFEFPGTLFP